MQKMTEIGMAHATHSTPAVRRPGFDEVYDECFELVWRSLRRLGVREGSLDDAVQEVFLVVHRKLGEFEGRSSVRTWVFGIVLKVARDHRRTHQRKEAPLARSTPEEIDALLAPERSPHDAAVAAEANRVLQALLDSLDEEKRAIFLLAELEELPMPEIADALGLNLNTAYSRLRAARKDFEQALARHRAGRKMP